MTPCDTIVRRLELPLDIGCRHGLQGLGNCLFQILPSTGGLRSQERVDLCPTPFDGRQLWRVLQEIEEANPSPCTHFCHPRHGVSFAILEDDMARVRLRHEYLLQKREKDHCLHLIHEYF